MSLKVALLAGGRATRLGAVSRDIPKSLIDVGGRPFAVHQIELLRRWGLTDVVFCVGHLGGAVVETLGDGSRWGVRIRYVHDGLSPLGTGGALRKALPLLGDAFFVLYGDSYLDCDYADVERAFETCGKLGLMTVFRNNGQWDDSNVLFTDGRIRRYDKGYRASDMQHIDYGLGALRAGALLAHGEGSFDLSAVYQRLLADDQLAASEVISRFYEIGSPEGLAETRAYLAGGGSAP